MAMHRTLLPLRASCVSKVLNVPWNAVRSVQSPSAGRRSRSSSARSTDKAATPATTVPVPEVYTETTDPELTAYQQHQKTAARLSPADHAKTLVHLAKFGLLATVSVSNDTQGLPLGSVVEFAANDLGQPVFAVSSLSAHCADLEQDQRASLTVMVADFKGLSDARFTLQGRVRPVQDAERPKLREAFLKKYPDAFWVDFGDFKWFIMDEISVGRYNGGFAMAKKLTGEEYLSAGKDPVAQFSLPVCSHMNDDHEGDMKAMIKHYVGIQVDSVRMLDLDRLGMNFQVKHKGQGFKLRLPFVKPADDRKGIKEAIVEMTRAAASA